MQTALCETFGIEYPIFAFTHCRDVVAAVSKAGGLSVLGAVGFSPEQLEIELDWIDAHVDGRPYGVDTVMPQKAADVNGSTPAELVGQIRAMIPEQHWRFVDELIERFGLSPLPEGEEAQGVIGWAVDVARRHLDVAFAHPIKLIANARIARSHRKDLDFAPVGQIVGRMNTVQPVRDVMYSLVEEYIETVERLRTGIEAGQN